MVEAYFYIPAESAENAVECGIKLSEWYSREVNLEGEKKRCISALLNPRDDLEKYNSPVFRCLKLEVQFKYCFAADRLLYQAGLAYSEAMDRYEHSIIPINQYKFGSYRLPECLVTSTIIGEHINVLGKGLDTPVLYSNSQELYFSNILEGFRETHDDFNDAMLYHFLNRLCAEGKATVLEDLASGLAIFTDNRTGQVYTLKIPNMEMY